MRRVLTVLVAVVVVCAVQAVSFACSILLRPEAVGTTFGVRVVDRGRPVAGLAVKLSDGRPRHRAVADREGVARFVDVPAGSYIATPDHPASFWSSIAIEVNPSNSTEVTVPVHWPAREPLVARSLRGVLRISSLKLTTQPEMPLELLDHMTGRVLRTARTDGKGAFRFPAMPYGLYFLRIQSPAVGENPFIPVEVKREADSAAFKIEVSFGYCGMYYVDRVQCPLIELPLARFVGSVVDAGGRTLDHVEIKLVDEGGNLVQRMGSDAQGQFGPLERPPGRYRLLITQPGFSALEIPVTIDLKGDQRPMDVKLGLMGACSSARLR